MLSTYECMFPWETLKKQSSSILKGDHQELDDLEVILEEDKANICLLSVQHNGLSHLADSISLSTRLHYHHIK